MRSVSNALWLPLNCREPCLHQAEEGLLWIMNGDSTRQCEELASCKIASRSVPVKHIHECHTLGVLYTEAIQQMCLLESV